MMKVIVKRTNEYVEMMDESTGVIKKIPLASDAQMNYLNGLRFELYGKKLPLKNRPFMYEAKRKIDKLLKVKEARSAL